MTTPKVFDLGASECYGCGACEQSCNAGAIAMVENSEGFLYPILDASKCVDCGLCDRVCPSLVDKKTYGREAKVLAAYNKDNEILEKSSSGGIFSILADKVIGEGGVVFGVIQRDDFKVVHTYATTYEELNAMRGSKYVQSIIGNSYKDVRKFLKDGRVVLFTGTPCQIGGLNSYLRKDYSNLITCELICHGAPSQRLLMDYCTNISSDFSKSHKVSFRETRIWNFSTTLTKGDSSVRIKGKKDYYMKAFFSAYTYRESCYSCKFASLPRTADVTIADFWGIDKKSKGYSKKGSSLILINSDKGNSVVDSVLSSMDYAEHKIEDAVSLNGNIVRPTKRKVQRDTFYYDHQSMPMDMFLKKYGLNPTLRNHVGYIYRAIKSKLMR